MLFHLADYLTQYVSGFNLFTYTTSRAVFATLTALAIGFVCGPSLIRRLQAGRIGQQVRDDGPQSHQSKKETPTMGGGLILMSLAVATLLWGDWRSDYLWPLLFAVAAFAAIGYWDDSRKIARGSSHGLSAKRKLILQSAAAIAFLLWLVLATPLSERTILIIPYLKDAAIPLGVFGFVAVGYFVIVGASNAVNLTDGLDGLAILPAVMVCGGLGVFAYVAGHAEFSEYLGFPHIVGAEELVIFCAAFIGAGLAFLWFNAYPAEVFMGDIGSLALGAALGAVAVIIRQEIVFFIMSGVFVVETLSVMAQVASFKLTGRRMFRMAPLHHHFELKGWRENQVVVRFWIITIILVLIGLSALKIR